MRGVEDRRAVLTATLDWLMIVAAAALAVRARSPLATVAAVIVIAGRQVALLNLVHAAAHGALFRRRALMRSINWWIAAPIFDSVESYRGPHLEHHEEFARRAPDRFAFLHGQLGLDRRGALGRTWIVFLRPLAAYETLQFARACLAALRRERRFALRMLVFWPLALAGAWSLGALSIVVLYWLVPLLFVYPIFNLWAEISDHFNVEGPIEARDQEGWFFALFLKGHDPYHRAHHTRPSVPFYRLKYLRDTRSETVRGLSGFLRSIYRGTNHVGLAEHQ